VTKGLRVKQPHIERVKQLRQLLYFYDALQACIEETLFKFSHQVSNKILPHKIKFKDTVDVY